MKHLLCVAHRRGLGLHVADVGLLVLTYTVPGACDFGESHMERSLEALFSDGSGFVLDECS